MKENTPGYMYYQPNIFNFDDPLKQKEKKSRIRETPTLSTDADSRTDTNLKGLHDLSIKKSCIQETKNLSTDADSRTDTNLKRLHDLSFFLN